MALLIIATFLTCVSCWFIQILVLAFIRAKFKSYRNPENSAYKVPESVSVVICAHNEAAVLGENLPAVLAQEWEDFEVIVVNDASTDDTAKILSEMAARFSRLKVIYISQEEKIHGGKKQALDRGIREAQGEVVLLTDADCHPATSRWIAAMVSGFRPGIDIVLGYSPARPAAGLLNALIRVDTLNIAVQYLTAAMLKKPYMGTGRNLAYQRTLMDKPGLEKHMDLISGDDDLFINQLANKRNTTIVICREAWMWTDAKKTWKAYFRQKKRHLTTGFRYRKKDVLFLGIVNGSKWVFFSSFIGMFCYDLNLRVAGSGLILLYAIQLWYAYYPVTSRLGERSLLLFIPIIDVISVFFNSFVIALSFFSKSKQWK